MGGDEKLASPKDELVQVKEEEHGDSEEADQTASSETATAAEGADPEVGSSTSQLNTEEQQRTYANLQPIFLAMEMGQDAVQIAQGQDQNQETALGSSIELGQQQQTFIATTMQQVSTSENFTQPTQVASLLATSGSEASTSLASILQDVVSGMQSGTGTVPAAIITDPNSGSGSFLIVNQNGVPIVRPVLVSNLPAGGVGPGGAVSVSPETLQVLTAGLQSVEETSGSGGQESVTVDVSGDAEGQSVLSI